MIVTKNRKELEKELIKSISKIKAKKRVVNDIKKELMNYEILPGDVQAWINNPEDKLFELDLRQLFLLTEQVFYKTGDLTINPENYFTEAEIKEARQYSGVLETDKLEFPITFTNATVVGQSAYMVTMSIQTIKKLLDSMLLNYNFEVQREAKFTKRKDKIIMQPTLNKKNVKEIAEHLLNGTLVPTVLVFNAATRTSEVGDEIIYDPKKLELTITKGTRLDIVDGYHRCQALSMALETNPDLEFNFAVLITNYSTKKAQQYQAQLAKATPISRTRIQELEQNRLSDIVVQQLREESDLQGRISQTNRIHTINNELVTYNVLADTIDEEFDMKTRADAMDVGDYLVELFNMLIGSYPDEFINNVDQTRKVSLINDNNMFVGYIVLARKMYESKIKPKEVRNILKNIDFSRTNKLWEDIGVLDNEGKIKDTTKARKAIKNYFESLEVGEF